MSLNHDQVAQIAFIDANIPDSKNLIGGISADIKVVVIDPTRDGIEQITTALAGGKYSAIHIISHGSEGSLHLPSATLNQNTLDTYSSQIQQWRNALTEDADILLYGCNVGADLTPHPPLLLGEVWSKPVGDERDLEDLGDKEDLGKESSLSNTYNYTLLGEGEKREEEKNTPPCPPAPLPWEGGVFLTRLSQLTGADIAASNDLTGNTAQGGDWELEVNTGSIETPIAFVAGSTDTYNGVLNGDLIWTKQLGGSSFDIATSITVDSNGNVYTTGNFQGTADFDPSSGTFNLTSAGDADIFVTKLNADGTLAWAKQVGGSSFDLGNSIAVDSNSNVYTTGNFFNTADFDPSSGTFNLTSAGEGDIFVTKLNSNGTLVWAKQLGGSKTELGNSITADNNGNVYTTGYFLGAADFDPSSGTFNLTSGGGKDIFVTKLNSDGALAWAKQLGGSDTDVGNGVTVDSNGNVYITGDFQGTADFDPSGGTFNLTSRGDADIFVTKLNSDGTLAWAKQLGGSSTDLGNSIAVDSNGNIYTTGYFRGIADFDGGSNTFNLTSVGDTDIFVTKLNSDGTLAWAKQLGGSSTDVGSGIAVDSNDNAYITGYFYATADFDPSGGTFNLTSGGDKDAFVTKLNRDGTLAWAKQLGGSSFDVGSGIAVDSKDNAYTTGYFQGTADFDPSGGRSELTSGGNADIFVTKLGANVPTVSIDNPTIIEGTGGTKNLSFTVGVSDTITQPISVDYFTVAETATADIDYTTKKGTINFNPGGSLTQTIDIAITTDNINEANETFQVELKDAVNAAISLKGKGTGTITNDDINIAIANQSSTVNSLYNFNIPNGSFTDINDATLTYTATLDNGNPLPTWLSFNPNTRTFVGTPRDWDVGQINVVLKTTNGSSASTKFNLTVNPFPINLDCFCKSIIRPNLDIPVELNAIASTQTGNDSNDTLIGTSVDEAFYALLGDDWIEAQAGNDNLFGAGGNDTVLGGSDRDFIFGNEGDDIINGNQNNDVVSGNQGNDTVRGGQNNDMIYGGRDNDLLWGDRGDDTLSGDKGNDTIFGGVSDASVSDANKPDLLLGGEGDDLMNGNQGNDTLFGDQGNDSVWGGKNDDIVLGGDRDDLLFGNKANDSLCGGSGNDTIFGGNGSDVPIGANGEQDCICGGEGNDLLLGNEGQDRMCGEEGEDTLYGGKDDDIISGGEGNDRLSGDLGRDLLRGSLGSDRFVLTPGKDTDTILDFEDGIDLLELTGNLAFNQLNITTVNNSTFISIAQTSELLMVVNGYPANFITQQDFFFNV